MVRFALVIVVLLGIGILTTYWWYEQRSSEPEQNPVVSGQEKEPEAPVFETRKQVRDVTPQEFSQAPEIQDEILERLPAVTPPPPIIKEKPRFWKSPKVLQAGVLQSGSTRISLSNITPLSIERVCLDALGNSWPCGKFGRTAFRNFVRGRTLSCEPSDQAQVDITLACKIGGTDLSKWLVATGWVEPKAGHFEAESERAKQEKRGIWRESAP